MATASTASSQAQPRVKYVEHSDGTREVFDPQRLSQDLRKLATDSSLPPLDPLVDVDLIVHKAQDDLITVNPTASVREYTAKVASQLGLVHYDFHFLASRILIADLHRKAPPTFADAMELLHLGQGAPHTQTPATRPVGSRTFMHPDFMAIVRQHRDQLNQMIKPERDCLHDYFGFQTLYHNGYLMTAFGQVAETPQYRLLRVAVQYHGNDLVKVQQAYETLSTGLYIPATPTQFNAGKLQPQMSSCFLLNMGKEYLPKLSSPTAPCIPPEDDETDPDSIDGIYDTLKRCAKISKHAGGIGLEVTSIRAAGSVISSNGGKSDGIVPMLQVYEATAKYVNQGGKRKGAFAIYMEPWHADFPDFLELKDPAGHPDRRTLDLFTACFYNDLFLERAFANQPWSLFCPTDAPDLLELYGDAFAKRYQEYEAKGVARQTVSARNLLDKLLTAGMECGTPYMVSKCQANLKTNYQHLGTIKTSNLCAEILEYVGPDEVAVCNLCSVALPKIVVPLDECSEVPDYWYGDQAVDFHKLYEVTYQATINSDRIIDLNFYPVEQARRSNMRHRPLAVGVQGEHDLLQKMGLAYKDEEAKRLIWDVYETMYHASLRASCDLARQHGPFPSFAGSPFSRGILQFDMWGVTPTDRWDWAGLKAEIRVYGTRHIVLGATMPTASSAQILGNSEGIEPYYSNVFVRSTQSGQFDCINRNLVKELQRLNKWNLEMRQQIMEHRGSIQKLALPARLKKVYKTVWEIGMSTLLQYAAIRGPFLDQTQSMSAYMATPTLEKMRALVYSARHYGLKTAMYYMRRKPPVDPNAQTKKDPLGALTPLIAQQEQKMKMQALVEDGPGRHSPTHSPSHALPVPGWRRRSNLPALPSPPDFAQFQDPQVVPALSRTPTPPKPVLRPAAPRVPRKPRPNHPSRLVCSLKNGPNCLACQ